MEKIEAETQWLRYTVLPKILRNGRLVENYSDSKVESFHVGDIDIDVIGHSEAFMLTFCYRTTINFEYDGEKFQRKMVVKKTPAMPPDMYASVQFGPLFANEINFYTEILPEIQKLADGKFAAPKYYYSELNENSAVVILENFAEQGWRVTKDQVGLSLRHAMIAVNYLGRFHAFTYAMKHKSPEKFAQLASSLKESRYATDNIHADWKVSLRASINRAAKAVATYQPQIDEQFVKKFGFLVSKYTQYGRQRVAPREPLATLCHGDYLRNNVAYRYDDKEEPQEIMMFDYQTLRISSPMVDLAVFLAVSIYAEVRDPHFEAIFSEYTLALHNSYRERTKEEVPDFLSRGELLKEYVRFLPYSVSITSFFLMTLVEPLGISPEEMFALQQTDEEITERAMVQGGEVVDKEIAHQVKEMLELSQATGVSIDDGIDVDKLAKE
ncbi:uncharacterized protein LOC6548656 [Drosophila erecta]|uniref:CHK kinase-like domain-containing protein n=1 Tax=Drosophila erecta TaxID=7220 RepID=B3NPL1_DROER|nr:uncharacterized protein LOC6548656 [Drosophila erecta]EDV55778.1 uncharacterized protein Dere_GG20590 [Drosophila erecta]